MSDIEHEHGGGSESEVEQPRVSKKQKHETAASRSTSKKAKLSAPPPTPVHRGDSDDEELNRASAAAVEDLFDGALADDEPASAARADMDADSRKRKRARTPAPPAIAEESADVMEDGDESKSAVEDADEEEGKQSQGEEDDDDDGLLKPYVPSAKALKSLDIPAGTNFSNPNNTIKWHSVKKNLNVHYTQINTKKHLLLHETPPKKGYDKTFFTVKCLKPQKFDFTGGTNFRTPMFDSAIVVGPFSVVQFPRMWPYGDRFPLPNSKFPAPDEVGKIKYKLPIHNNPYANILSVSKDGVGLVDADCDVFLSTWVRMQFSSWTSEASWKVSATQFPVVRKKLLEAVEQHLAQLKGTYEEALAEWNAKKKKAGKTGPPVGPAPKKPDTSNAHKEMLLREYFLARAFDKSLVSKDAKGYEHVNLQAPLLKGQTKKERDLGKKPVLPNDPWFIQQYIDPPMWEDKNKKEMKPGFPKIPNDIPMLRAVILEEALELKKRGINNDSPCRLVPRENRFIVSGDVVAPIFAFDKYDSQLGSGWRFILVGVIWLGESGKLDEHKKAPAWSQLDPTTYFLMAQKYERTKANFNPDTVESARYNSTTEDEPSMPDQYGIYPEDVEA